MSGTLHKNRNVGGGDKELSGKLGVLANRIADSLLGMGEDDLLPLGINTTISAFKALVAYHSTSVRVDKNSQDEAERSMFDVYRKSINGELDEQPSDDLGDTN